MPPEYRTWRAIKTRCLNPKCRSFPNYGGRGIRICEEWRDDFSAFYAAVGAQPAPRSTLDRIDNERGYEPGNVRWASASEQNANKRNNVLVRINGEDVPATVAARMLGVKTSTMFHRISRGWTNEELVRGSR